MSALHAEVYEAFRVLDVPDDKACVLPSRFRRP
jgi:hypothetical protein